MFILRFIFSIIFVLIYFILLLIIPKNICHIFRMGPYGALRKTIHGALSSPMNKNVFSRNPMKKIRGALWSNMPKNAFSRNPAESCEKNGALWRAISRSKYF